MGLRLDCCSGQATASVAEGCEGPAPRALKNLSAMTATSVSALHNVATQLRIDSIRSTTAAASGHPTSCLSAADIMAVLFFGVMRFDPKDPRNPDNDRFVLSKGHAAPIL